MSLPAQLQKQSKDIQDLYEKMGKDDEPNQDVIEPDKPAEPDPKQSPEKPAKPAEPQNDQTLAQKYRTLQGMYNAEVPKLHQTNKMLQDRVQNLEQLLSSFQSSQPKKPESAPTKEVKLITDKEIEEFGDSIDIMRKAAQEVYAAKQGEIDELKAQLAQLQPLGQRMDKLAQSQVVSAEQAFWSDLSMLEPDWQTINANQDFQTWLLQMDPLTGYVRQDLLENAQSNLDARRVTAFFKEWANVSGSGNEPQQPTSQSAPDKRAAELAKQVSPGKSRQSSKPEGNQPKNYTRADISAFYHDVAMGKYKGRDADRQRVEQEIFLAQSENRIAG